MGFEPGRDSPVTSPSQRSTLEVELKLYMHNVNDDIDVLLACTITAYKHHSSQCPGTMLVSLCVDVDVSLSLESLTVTVCVVSVSGLFVDTK